MRRTHRLVKVLAGLLITAIAVSGFAAAYVSKLVGNINTEEVNSKLGEDRPDEILYPEDGAPINIVVMGSDTREGQGNGFGGSTHLGSQRSDTTMLVHISGNRDWATAVSIPRDTWVAQPDCVKDDGSISPGYSAKFNETFSRGGPACVIKTIEQITDIRVHHFVVVDFKGFKSIVNALGGVEICLTEAVNDKDSKLNLPAGVSTVMGQDAIAFVRARYSLGDGSDISRIRRQQDFLASMVRKATSAGILLNPTKLYSVLSAITESLTTNPELGTIDGLTDMAVNLRDLRPSSVRFITAPNQPYAPDPNNVEFSPTADELWNALRNDVQWPKPPTNGPDGKPLTVDPSDIKIGVLNGTTTKGLAANKASLFEELGYKVAMTGNSDETFGTKTAVFATAKRANEARTVAAALGLDVVTTFKLAKKGDPSLVVVVGEDFKDPKSVRIKVKPTSTLYGPQEGRAADETDCSPA